MCKDENNPYQRENKKGNQENYKSHKPAFALAAISFANKGVSSLLHQQVFQHIIFYRPEISNTGL